MVTQVALLAAPRPTSVQVAFLACPDFGACVTTMLAAKRALGDILSAAEFLDRQSLDLVTRHLAGTTDPLSSPSPFYLLLETSGFCAESDRARLESVLEVALADGSVTDGTVAGDVAHAASLWALRERVTEALVAAGAVYKYDVSLPTGRMYELVTAMRTRLQAAGGAAAAAAVVGYGHIGDGNLHLNVSAPAYDPALQAAIEPFVYEFTRDARGRRAACPPRPAGLRGCAPPQSGRLRTLAPALVLRSVSAEHGLGAMKAGVIHYSKPPEAVEMMRSLKQLFDPTGILNPGKVLEEVPTRRAAQKAAEL